MEISRYKLSLTVAGPVLPRATAIGRPGIDAPILRQGDRLDGLPVIPGSHVAGKLREAWAQLGEIAPDQFTDIDTLFGAPGFAPDTVVEGPAGQRKRVILPGDLVADHAGRPDGRRTRVKISDETGTVERGALQVLEAPYAPGDKVTFTGALIILGNSSKGPDAAKIADRLRICLNWILQLGGLRGAGFGRVLTAELKEANGKGQGALPEDADRLRLVLAFETPFCISERPVYGNMFHSVDHVAGRVIKGVLARLISHTHPESGVMAPVTPAILTRLHIGQAEPVYCPGTTAEERLEAADGLSGRRPLPCPESLATAGEKVVVDLAEETRPVLIDGMAPSHPTDWKTTPDAVRAMMRNGADLASPDETAVGRVMRVRTAISPERRRAARSQLFGQECCRVEDHVWLGHIDLYGLDKHERGHVRAALANLARTGLVGIGKTDATALIRVVPESLPAVPVPEVGRPIRMLIVTETLLCPPDVLGRHQGLAELRAAYARVIDELSGGTLRLHRAFTTEAMRGGAFHARKRPPKTQYRPWGVTQPGSLFVIEPTGTGDATPVLTRWSRIGLPVPPSVLKDYELDGIAADQLWNHCPWLPENGHGAVVFDPPRPEGHLQDRTRLTPIHLPNGLWAMPEPDPARTSAGGDA